ncbi:MAG: UTP--glucose-1-phosphate uridylyltransferase, partial [Fibrobacter sp.]|nr:UTP--glucose-1-phosphate uridylyltransferase [Fibrobacter sp.]
MNILASFIQKMEHFDLPQSAKDTFIHYFNQLQSGITGLVAESEISSIPQNEILKSNSLPKFVDEDNSVLKKTVIIKLNGGLGTTMGLQGPKSLIPVKNDLNFLDITALQIRRINQQY